ncbi:predicted protein [Waddlia chondrophila 2032/99]|uniref:Predicted protein n=1 Tax=Waddlia chondrophila 2032/99 TaxID=765953 RepID=F8LE72_9BACT|nr:hypothetical protein [Waddlia chondrophila]CCB91786.1 predicted protein [Waddlia chondrophila 2032/99]
MNREIKLDQTGKILSGKSKGWFLRVEETDKNSGNFLILVSKDSKFSRYAEGYDYWAENFDELQEIFKETSWIVSWKI